MLTGNEDVFLQRLAIEQRVYERTFSILSAAYETKLTIDIVPRMLMLALRLALLPVALLMRMPPDAQPPFHERHAPADPPTIAPVHQLVRAPAEAAELRGAALHLREPAQEARGVDARRRERPRGIVCCYVRLQEDPAGGRAEGVAAVGFAEWWAWRGGVLYRAICARVSRVFATGEARRGSK